ncbi:MAG: hypothetical protein CBC47_00935 [Alphaproteobacteria bacterium TMED87]|nr:hypothetical protein [Rhodospirillaceae bacterium]OUV11708.1 MAG: hypothetical protein CBC47_00935 [Alphaproteobacteria bacterium TMED87]
MINPVVYIPLELKSRDLDSRLILAVELINKGLNIVIGQQWSLSKNIFNVPQGLFLFKTVNEIQATQMVDAVDAGHIVSATDEEVLACACDECFESGLCHTAAKNMHLFFANSKKHAEIVKNQYTEMKNKTIITGNPRMEIAKKWGKILYQKEIMRIKNEIGPYFLFNTNFGWVNSIWKENEDPRDIAIRTGHLELGDKRSIEAYKDEIDWEKSNMYELERVIEWFTKLDTPLKTVIRPHPAEDVSYWKKKYSHKDIYIIESSPPTPWILASEALIHTTCTTGFEARLLEVPSLSITPKINSKYHSYILSNLVSPTAKNYDEAVEAISDFILGNNNLIMNSNENNTKMKEFFPDLDKISPVRNISEIILNNIQKNIENEDLEYKWTLRKDCSWVNLNRRKEWINKFSASTEEIASKVQIIGNILNVNKEIKVQKIDDSLFNIWSN